MKKQIRLDHLELVAIATGAYCDPITGECYLPQENESGNQVKQLSVVVDKKEKVSEDKQLPTENLHG